MKLTLNVVAMALIAMGAIWVLQGINILPGSFMTGNTQWAKVGAVLMVGGIALLLGVNLKRNRSS